MSSISLSSNSALKGVFSMVLYVAILLPCAAAASENRSVTTLDRQIFDREVLAGSDDWVLLICDDAVAPCKHMTESFKKLLVIWEGTGLYHGTRFGEVSCTRDPGLCKQTLNTDGALTAPAAVHYRNGIRLASWIERDDAQKSMVWQFVAWVKSELAPLKQELPAVAAATHQSSAVVAEWAPFNEFSFWAPFADMDVETTAVGWCLLLGAIATVAWVIVEGFELWPAGLGKKEMGSLIPAF